MLYCKKIGSTSNPRLQVTVPSVALSHATATTTAATAATPRLPPAPAPPKTAVRQNGLGVTWPSQRNVGQTDLLNRSSRTFCCFSMNSSFSEYVQYSMMMCSICLQERFGMYQEILLEIHCFSPFSLFIQFFVMLLFILVETLVRSYLDVFMLPHDKDMTAKSSLDRGDNLTLTAATIQAGRVNLTSELRLPNKGSNSKERFMRG